MKMFTTFILALAATLFAANNSQAKYLDDETDLIYYGSRYYSPTLGRWLGRDTAGEKSAVNLLLFCHNSPVGRFDTDGCDDTVAEEGVVGGLAAGIGAMIFGSQPVLSTPRVS
jgi:RHS repeat-associated protein